MKATLMTRGLVLANAVLATYLMGAALSDEGGWHDGWRDVWAGLALLWLVTLCTWVLRRVRLGLPV